MHRGVRDKLEEILAGAGGALCERHLSECEECSAEVAAMREQRGLLRSLRAADSVPEQSAGFYARVIERIEAQGVVSIWQLFFDSPVGRGLAMASMLLALSLGVYVVSAEHGFVENSAAPDARNAVVQDAGGMLTGSPDANAVLVNLVTYREQ
jgi:anti-sigma factor RsiW